jgi:hypothetical protein
VFCLQSPADGTLQRGWRDCKHKPPVFLAEIRQKRKNDSNLRLEYRTEKSEKQARSKAIRCAQKNMGDPVVMQVK